MKCLEKCEFLLFEKGNFKCGYYDIDLVIEMPLESSAIEPQRCKECIEDKHIGSNTTNESVKKIKYRIGLIGDSFYSFKDDLESELAEIYRLIKDLEEKTENE